MNSSSPANCSISTTAIVGGGGASASNAALEDFQFPSDLISMEDRKDEAMLVLESDLMAALNEEVKSLDEDNWKFEGPSSHIHLISRPEADGVHKESKHGPTKMISDFLRVDLIAKSSGFDHQQLDYICT